MIQFASALSSYVLAFVRSRHDLGLEILVLRQQLAVLKRRQPRPGLNRLDRLFWVALYSLWNRWTDALIVVKPETVVRWHRAGFRLYWRMRSRISRMGRRRIEADVVELVKRMARENPSWGAPKIHGELLKLGIEISERAVSRYLLRHTPAPADAVQRWRAFLKNHREAIVALDFFTVPTLTFRLLYCFSASSSSTTTGVGFSTSMSPPIRRPSGCASSFARPSQMPAPTHMPSWTATPNSALKS